MQTRRRFLKNALYTAPLVLTVAVRPSYARSGYTNPPQGGGGGSYAGGGAIDLGSDTVTPTVSDSPGSGHSGGHKDPHDWWQFWRKL